MEFLHLNSRASAVIQLGIVLLIVPIAFGAPQEDLVQRLPGQKHNVSFKQYAGYINLYKKDGRALFYYFVEAEKDPANKPLALWLTGGPGCSSLGYGAFVEHGPFKPKGNHLHLNRHSWNRETNMLYVESPIGVGFSYSNITSDYNFFNDTFAAQDNLEFLLEWYEKFPEFRDADFYITGESYAGHYVPQFATLVLEYNERKGIKPIKLKGISLGNPLLDIEYSIQNGDYLWSHGVISDETYQLDRKVCNTSRYWLEAYVMGNLSEECESVDERISEEMGSASIYDVILDACISKPSYQIKALHGERWQQLHQKNSQNFNKVDLCIEDETTAYLNRPDVQKALHANTTGLPYKWDLCYGPLNYNESNRGINIIPVLANIIKAGIHTILYSGDQDAIVPLIGTRTIANILAKELGLHALTPYRCWYDNQQTAGWTQAFGQEGKNESLLTYATVRGAHHEVPYTSPSEALTLYKSFIRGLLLPQS